MSKVLFVSMDYTGDEDGCVFAAEIKSFLIDLKEEIRAIKVNQVFGGGRCFKVSVNQSLAKTD